MFWNSFGIWITSCLCKGFFLFLCYSLRTVKVGELIYSACNKPVTYVRTRWWVFSFLTVFLKLLKYKLCPASSTCIALVQGGGRKWGGGKGRRNKIHFCCSSDYVMLGVGYETKCYLLSWRDEFVIWRLEFLSAPYCVRCGFLWMRMVVCLYFVIYVP